MAKNRIIVFANQKGGVGKTTLCVMMAHWLHDNGKKVVVYDADSQQTLRDRRVDDLKINPNVQPPWDVRSIDSLDIEATIHQLQEAAEFNGYVLVDAPGALIYPGLAPILQTADAVVVPFDYDYNVLKSTWKFIDAITSSDIGKEHDRIFFVPNRIEENVGTKEEKEQAEEATKELNKFGRVTYRVKKGIKVKRYSTLTYDKYQMLATRAPWTTITNKLNKLH